MTVIVSMMRMNQKIVALCVIILSVSMLVGCTEKSAEKDRFIGEWNGYYEMEGLPYEMETEAIFYANDTLKTVYYQINDSEKDIIKTDWVKYTIENGKLYYKDIVTGEILTYSNYTFSNDYKTLTVISEKMPELKYILIKVTNR